MFQQKQMEAGLLRPADYWSRETFDREQEAVFADHWHFVGLEAQLAAPGSNLAVEICRTPVVVRRDGGDLVAFKNICPHRHSLIVPLGAGNSPTLRCQYHGWEFDRAGQLSHLPDGRSFKGFKARTACLASFRVDVLGGLVFVNLGTNPVSLQDYLGAAGEQLHTKLRDCSRVWTLSSEHPVNWKVVYENSLEGYHSAIVHAGTSGAAADERSIEHTFTPRSATYRFVSEMTRRQRALEMGVRALSMPSARLSMHVQHALYPTYLVDYTGVECLFTVIEPLAPDRTRTSWHSFLPNSVGRGRVGTVIREAIAKRTLRGFGPIVAEDIALWPSIQRGLASASGAAVLGRREERIHHFQTWLTGKLGR